jgi:hypothetical protein
VEKYKQTLHEMEERVKAVRAATGPLRDSSKAPEGKQPESKER